jgi:hypothetical protein
MKKSLATFIENTYLQDQRYPSYKSMFWYLNDKFNIKIHPSRIEDFKTLVYNIQRVVRNNVKKRKLKAAELALKLWPKGTEIEKRYTTIANHIVHRWLMSGWLDLTCPKQIENFIKMVHEIEWITTRDIDEIPLDGHFDSTLNPDFKDQSSATSQKNFKKDPEEDQTLLPG